MFLTFSTPRHQCALHQALPPAMPKLQQQQQQHEQHQKDQLSMIFLKGRQTDRRQKT